ncbi:hypothetical protein KP509_28G015200 [Ceratopteris richardii]|uniref:PUM-HD domain-containing protein n=1 Tax=Ceratopteris richardii TaxID=49495 RepID=A0A8T2RBN9_CERRI|nr:hypothetical protein KP509_28G015200 [Ceratopteris richardii]KAH7293188.1 hypothetical protein KP509_28G015200 [Ceratopteris richardii]KAH7293192.1 hypothetical protein KP509_28G015200 [Ceratopteris richardii]KAH7293194.1 hypothetical protein KP509_28G015200 [Ceratopteris richardii]
MATENPMRIMATSGGLTLNETIRSSSPNRLVSSSVGECVAQELGMLLRSHNRLDNFLSEDVLPHRSGSAPPIVQGSLAAIGSFLPAGANPESSCIVSSGSKDDVELVGSEQELRSDPSYLAYYYSHINSNPRLPPPIITRDNYLLAQHLTASSPSDKIKLRSLDDNNKKSLFLSQPRLPTYNEEPEPPEDEKTPINDTLKQVSDNCIDKDVDVMSLSSLYGSGARHKSLVDLIQQDFPRTPSPVYNQSRSSNRVNVEEGADNSSGRESLLQQSSFSTQPVPVLNAALTGSRSAGLLSTDGQMGLHSIGNTSMGVSAENSAFIGRVVAPDCSKVNEFFPVNIQGANGTPKLGTKLSSLRTACTADLDCAFQTLTLSSRQVSAEQREQSNHPHWEAQAHPHSGRPQKIYGQQSLSIQGQSIVECQTISHALQQRLQLRSLDQVHVSSGMSHFLNQNAFLQPLTEFEKIAAGAAALSSINAGDSHYPSPQAATLYAPQFGISGYSNPSLLPGIMTNHATSMSCESVAATGTSASAAAGVRSQSSSLGPPKRVGLDMQQLLRSTSQPGLSLQSQLSDPLYLRYLQQRTTNDLGDHKAQFAQDGSLGIPMQSKSNSISSMYYGSPPGVGFIMPYTNSPLSSSLLARSPGIPGALFLRHAGRSTAGGAFGSWQIQGGGDIGEDLRGSSLLDELKNSKTRRFELADIAGHVVEFSTDQHGSRFIQQKLETASADEKALVFFEVLPRALSLMTDVFGNYVIQKFFEHGSAEQRFELAKQLMGHVLSLSLQMYGCRVIQKALEAVELEQKILIVTELDGHVMRCVRDQNGNHVIQKSIECVHPEHIQFIISAFYGQVVMLSMHPYGCRVIQRVLEHCTDEQKQNGIMDDIMRSACSLAQDQYGNYVVQHVLEHGKPHEKSDIMTKLAGQIVQMSQHKFASNVVEKCLEFGGPNERQILINEMLGDTEENEPLQAMMKDQYANYVVQKVLETCDDEQRELLLSRIRVHLHALKKYTYGKHIVARVEKLLTAGERRGAQLSV